jgi:hypothetical protein
VGIGVDVVGSGAPASGVLVEVFGEPMAGPFEPGPHAAAVIIERQQFSFGEGPAAFLAEWVGGDVSVGGWRRAQRSGSVGPMFNGRFVWTSDGRFGDALGEGAFARPVKLMDRWETPAEYATYD